RPEMQSLTCLIRKDHERMYEQRETLNHISLWVVHRGDKLSEKYNELISQAKSRAYLQLTTLIPQEVDDLRASMKFAREHGVSVKIVSFTNPRFIDAKSLSVLAEEAEVGVIEEPNPDSVRLMNICSVDGR